MNLRPYVIAFIGEKGGVGKTTSCVNVGAALMEMGLRVLMIDIDPQCGLSNYLGVRAEANRSMRAALTGNARILDIVVPTHCGLCLVPAHPALATVGTEVVVYAEKRLGQALTGVPGPDGESGYHFVLVDCPPSLDLLPINGIHAAHGVVVHVSPEVLPAYTLPRVLKTVEEVRTMGERHSLRVLGVLPCRVVTRARLSQEIAALLPNLAPGVRVLPEIRQSVKVAEAPRYYLPLLQYMPQHPAADDYRRATQAILSAISNGRAPSP